MSEYYEDNLPISVVIIDPTIVTDISDNLPIKVVLCDANGNPYKPN